MFCPKCGTNMPNSAKFCVKCGYKFEKKEVKKGLSPKIRKKLIAIAGCCISLLILIYFGLFHFPKSDWQYYCYVDDAGKFCAEITGYLGDENELVIPETVRQGWIPYDVKSVALEVGSYNYAIGLFGRTNVKVRDQEQMINRLSSLTSIEIPDSVTSIEGNAFVWCSSLTSIEIPDSVTSIGHGAFRSCSSLTSIEIPDSVTSIGDSAFSCCSSLTSIEIPDSVTSIGHDAFWGCSSLTSIEIPDSVTSIGDSAFSGCSSLTSVELPEGISYSELGLDKEQVIRR